MEVFDRSAIEESAGPAQRIQNNQWPAGKNEKIKIIVSKEQGAFHEERDN